MKTRFVGRSVLCHIRVLFWCHAVSGRPRYAETGPWVPGCRRTVWTAGLSSRCYTAVTPSTGSPISKRWSPHAVCLEQRLMGRLRGLEREGGQTKPRVLICFGKKISLENKWHLSVRREYAPPPLPPAILQHTHVQRALCRPVLWHAIMSIFWLRFTHFILGFHTLNVFPGETWHGWATHLLPASSVGPLQRLASLPARTPKTPRRHTREVSFFRE